MSASKSFQGGPVHVGAGETTVVVLLRQRRPAFVPLAVDEGLGRLALGIERVEGLLESLVGRLPGVDGAADGWTAGATVPGLSLTFLSGAMRFSLGRPKNR